jgi:soluble lytic murein transglycosylase
MVYRGTVEAGRNAVGDLLANSVVRGLFKGRANILAARVARMEGRWDVVRDEVSQAIDAGVPSGEAQRWLPRLSIETAEPGQGEEKLRRLLAGRPVEKLKGPQLRTALDLAIHYEIRDVASEALTALTTQSARVNPQALYDAALDANGVASNEALLAAFDSVRGVRPLQLAATYYHARALEGLGRVEEARSEYHEVAQLDARDERFYGLWAEARLTALDQLASGSCDRDERGGCRPDVGLGRRVATTEGLTLATGPSVAGGLAAGSGRVAVPGLSAVFAAEHDELGGSAYLPNPADVRRDTIVGKLAALISTYGEAYPWLARALDLVELDLYDEAASEVGETYIAYRDARGGLRYRVGAEAVLSNAMQPRHECVGNVRRDRLALDESGKLALADVADLLNEPGVALRLRGMQMDAPPRAYAEDVIRASNKFGLDPNLMFAVMRVESVYYRHIVSFAGAVGLMQIMPQTGMRIARALGLVDFNPRELLEPRKNIEFAAWYLASLIRRFDGRIPLAVAAYNGGPHNVRLWINARPKTMPLDVFMEHLPFHETHHYVRRVLTNYSVYRAQEGLGMPNLAMSLPRPRPDAIAF